MQLKECKKRDSWRAEEDRFGQRVFCWGVGLHLRSPHSAGIMRLRTNTVLAGSLWHCCPYKYKRPLSWAVGSFVASADGEGLWSWSRWKSWFRLLSRRGICLRFRLRNVAPGQKKPSQSCCSSLSSSSAHHAHMFSVSSGINYGLRKFIYFLLASQSVVLFWGWSPILGWEREMAGQGYITPDPLPQ